MYVQKSDVIALCVARGRCGGGDALHTAPHDALGCAGVGFPRCDQRHPTYGAVSGGLCTGRQRHTVGCSAAPVCSALVCMILWRVAACAA